MKVLIFIISTLISFLGNCNGGTVLFLPPMMSSSHKIALVVWADALAERGHEVYWWAPAGRLDKYQPSKIRLVEHFEINLPDDRDTLEMFRYENATFLNTISWTDPMLTPSDEGYVNYLLVPLCESVMRDNKASIDRLLSRKYDLVIIDELFNNCGYLVSQLTKSPVATYDSACRTTSTSNRYNGIPIQFAYTPYLGLQRQSDSMTFSERVLSTIAWGIGNWANELIWFPSVTNSLKKYYPEIEPSQTSLMRPAFQFICMPKQLDITGPQVQNTVYMGGIQIPNNTKPLTEQFRGMIDSAKKGFILFAMGHLAKWDYAPESTVKAISEAFSRVPSDYLVIWQYNGPEIPHLPKHVKTVHWVPQQSLLADPKCKIFITHGGCNSFNEGIHFGVPMIALPLFGGDQSDDAIKIETMGFGFRFDKLRVTADQLHHAIMEVLQNKSYKENVQKMSDMIRGDVTTPLQRTIFWSEFVMRHGRSDHYRSSPNAIFSSSLKYYCLDILITFVVVTCTTAWLFFKLVFAIGRLVSKRTSS